MRNGRSIRPIVLLGASVVSGMVIALALLGFRGSRGTRDLDATPAPGKVTAPELVAAGEPPGREPAAHPIGVEPNELATRPETELLQELPKVQVTRASNATLSDFKVSFKLDSRLTQSLYMGDRWTAPRTYLQVGNGDSCAVEASIRGLNAEGKAVNITATWKVADPEMVKMSSPGPGNTVKLTVVRPGRTTIEIASQGITKLLPLHARRYGQTLLVAMAQ